MLRYALLMAGLILGLNKPLHAQVTMAHPDKIQSTTDSIELFAWWNSLDALWQKEFRNNISLLKEVKTKDLQRMWDLHSFRATQKVGSSDIKLTPTISDIIPLARLPKLRDVDISFTEVVSLSPLKNSDNLKYFVANSSQINDLSPLEGKDELVELNCGFTVVSDLSPIAECRSLRTLRCHRTAVNTIEPIRGLDSLRTLDISFLLVRDLKPLEKMQFLEVLYLKRTLVHDLSPLSDKKNLRYLDISGCKIKSLDALINLPNLETLACKDAKIKKKHLKKIQKLKPKLKIIQK